MSTAELTQNEAIATEMAITAYGDMLKARRALDDATARLERALLNMPAAGKDIYVQQTHVLDKSFAEMPSLAARIRGNL